MKKLIIGLGIATMVMGMASMASAATYDPGWIINIKASLTDGTGFTTSTFKTKAGWTAGSVGAEDSSGAPAGAALAVYAYSTNGGAASLFNDGRGSFTGQPIQWVINFGVARDTDPATTMIKFLAWNPNDVSPAGLNNKFVSTGETIKLYSTTNGIAKGAEVFNFLAYGNGSTTNTYSSGNIAIGSKYILEVAPAVVPEPGSMVAMLSGLAGLVGFGVRRRK